MGTLISVRHQLGAKGGEKFASALGLSIKREPEGTANEGDNVWRSPQLSSPVIPPRSTAMIPPGRSAILMFGLMSKKCVMFMPLIDRSSESHSFASV